MLPTVKVPTTLRLVPSQVSLFPKFVPTLNLYAEPLYPKKNPVPLLKAVCPPRIWPPDPISIPWKISPSVSKF